MPGDETHVKWAQYAAFVGSIVMYGIGIDLLSIICMAGIFMFGTKYVSPDLDIDSTPYQRWGILKVLFYPCVKLLKHRKLSHNLLVGPIIVVSYFSSIMLILCMVLNRFWLPVVEPMIDRAQEMLTQIMTLNLNHDNAVVIGVVLACLLAAAEWHIIIDTMFKGDRHER